MGHRSALAGIGSPSSTGSPSTLRMRPSAAFPTGTVIGPPLSSAGMPRTTPSVELIATARTWLRPMCCCTSATRRTPGCSMTRALYSSGSFSGSNSTSSTGPMTWTTLPTLCLVSPAGFFGAFFVLVAIVPQVLSLQSLRPTDDLRQLLRNLRLPCPIVRALQQLDDVPGVVGGVLHRGPLRAEERRRGFHE